MKETNTIIDEEIKVMMEIDKTLEFVEDSVRLEGEILEIEWKPTCKKVKAELKRSVEKKRKDSYEQKELQSDIYIDDKNRNAIFG